MKNSIVSCSLEKWAVLLLSIALLLGSAGCAENGVGIQEIVLYSSPVYCSLEDFDTMAVY